MLDKSIRSWSWIACEKQLIAIDYSYSSVSNLIFDVAMYHTGRRSATQLRASSTCEKHHPRTKPRRLLSRRQYGYIKRTQNVYDPRYAIRACKRDSLPSKALRMLHAKRTKRIPKFKRAVRSEWNRDFCCSNSRCRWDWDSYGPVREGVMLANGLEPGPGNIVRHKIARNEE